MAQRSFENPSMEMLVGTELNLFHTFLYTMEFFQISNETNPNQRCTLIYGEQKVILQNKSLNRLQLSGEQKVILQNKSSDQRISLNRSQRRNCSTGYNPLTSNQVVYKR